MSDYLVTSWDANPPKSEMDPGQHQMARLCLYPRFIPRVRIFGLIMGAIRGTFLNPNGPDNRRT